MKTNKYLLILMIVVCCLFAACGKKEEAPVTPDEPESEEAAEPEEPAEPEPEEEPSTAELSEKAMDNFLAKIDAGNYVIDAKEFLKTTVYSRDLVYFEYVDETYDDFAVMSVDNETFQGTLTGSGPEDVSFLGEGQAIEAAEDRLLNFWVSEEASQGNIYNLFYNDMEDPLKFVSYDDTVKMSLLSMVGYGQMALSSTQEVYMILDDVDPTVVHLQAVVEDNLVTRISYDDIDVEVTFGNAEINAEAEAWMSDPVYPEGRTEWNDTDIFILNSVFMPGYGEEAVPYPSFASYAMTIDQENFLTEDAVMIRDGRASEDDVNGYIETLKEAGFTEAEETDEDGNVKTVYRKLLREEYKCYSSIDASYNNGFDLVAKKFYDFPTYEGLDAVNEVITNRGYLPLPESENIVAINARDTACEMTESWLYFFDYDLGLYANVEFKDFDEGIAYLDEYGASLSEVGYAPHYTDEEESEIDMYQSEDELSSYRYHIEDDGTVTILFKAEKVISMDEAEAVIKEAGFPEIDFTGTGTCRDLKKYYKAQYDRDLDAFMSVGQTFGSLDEAGKFFDDYETALVDAGFGRVDPSTVGCNKAIALYNEETDRLVGIDFFEDDFMINFDFKAGS